MLFDLETISEFFDLPTAQFAVGAALGAIVWKFFKNVGDVLNDTTNKEIARWIRVKSFETGIVAEEAVRWPDSFAKVFDRVFGEKHVSWKCFWRSCIASSLTWAISASLVLISTELPGGIVGDLLWRKAEILLATVFFCNVFFDYFCLVKSRLLLRLLSQYHWPTLLLALDAMTTLSLVLIYGRLTIFLTSIVLQPVQSYVFIGEIYELWAPLMEVIVTNHGIDHYYSVVSTPTILLPAFFTSIWLWLYAASGFALKAARRFDIGFIWFNSKTDIEKKPLQAMGIVAGSFVAVLYWGVAAAWWMWKG